MIKIEDKSKCCGCEACKQACPKQCITFVEDKEGFLYPRVDVSLCIECGLCKKVCPFYNESDSVIPKVVFAAKNLNAVERYKSSSGGIFVLLAKQTLKRGGVVFGAKFNKKWEVVHSYTETETELISFMGSKYVQSRIGDVFCKVREFLKEGREVLFSGTPCQIRSLKLFLKSDYDNLLTVDFICHGVPSPGVFRWYIQEEINNYAHSASANLVSSVPIYSIPKGDFVMPKGLEIEDIQFRDKREGWKKYSLAILLSETLGEGKKKIVSLSSNICKNVFLNGFIGDLYLRPSCHNCPSRNFKSGSDVTLGDFWGQEKMFPTFDNDTGVSAVIIKTIKGQEHICKLINMEKEEKSLEQIISYNPSLLYSKPVNYSSKKFWNLKEKYTFGERVSKAKRRTLFERLYLKAIKILK